jgi:LysM repeat protein
MKNNTIYKPSISKERIAALEELISDQSKPYDSSPGVYVRSDKDRELDILWQGFKFNSKDERSPGIYLTIGFITGALCMFLMTTILNFGNPSKESFADLNLWKKANVEVKKKDTPVNVTPASQTQANTRTEKYTIQSGDTLASIAIKYYGNSSPDSIQKIQNANNMDNPDKIALGQELLIPLN